MNDFLSTVTDSVRNITNSRGIIKNEPLTRKGARRAMPSTNLVIYQEEDGKVPLRDWLDALEAEPRTRCLARIALLEQHGHALRRPHAENIGGGLYELRLKYRRVNLRMLYFFHSTSAVVVSHGFAKEREIPPSEIRIARARMARFLKNPARHTFRQEP